MIIPKLVRLLLTAICCLVLSVGAWAQPGVDVRLVIDVSGSMKATDPQNLRVPALELVLQLLPDGSRAGIWLFADEIVNLVPLAAVGESWRQRALARAGQVDSSGQLTDIGEALERVVLSGEDGSAQVIFLTDGKVDIGSNARRNSRERSRILEEILPKIKNTGSRLHTIALSDDADAELMAMLSRSTDGLHAVVQSAEELMPVFLQIFDQSVPAVRLPLENNRFLVDETVDEFTALIFHEPDTPPTELIMPSGESFGAASHKDAVNWYAADSYDLVTVSAPDTGHWEISGAGSEQNRVTVVSDLQLVVDPLPSHLVAGQPLQLRFHFLADGERLTDENFLQLLAVETLIEKTGTSARWQLPLEEEGVSAEGTFTQTLPALRERGQYRLTLLIDGKTFAREYQHLLQVGSLLGVEMQKLADPVRYRILVRADQQAVDVEHTAVVAHIKTSTGHSELETLEMREPGLWDVEITPTRDARYAIHLNASGRNSAGDPLSEVLPTQFFTYPAAGEEPPVTESESVVALRQQLSEEQAQLDALQGKPPVSSAEPEPEAVTTPEPEPEPEPQFEPEETEPVSADKDAADSAVNWLWVSLAIVGNIVVLGLIYLAYRKFSSRNVIDELEEIEQQLSQGAAEEKPKPRGVKKPDDDDPMKALDAMASPDDTDDDEELFPLDEKNSGDDPQMDDLDEDEDKPERP